MVARPGLPVWLMAAALVLATILAYLPVWHAGFIWDDDTFLLDNPLIKAGDGLYGFLVYHRSTGLFPDHFHDLVAGMAAMGQQPLGLPLGQRAVARGKFGAAMAGAGEIEDSGSLAGGGDFRPAPG